jgi:arginyl-tRNA synthetase
MQEIAQVIADKLGKQAEEIQGLFETPKDTSHGDLALPCFTFARDLKKAPQQIAQDLEAATTEANIAGVTAKAIGPFLNFTIDNSQELHNHLQLILSQGVQVTKDEPKTILVESPGPNTNKPLHLGHLRNMLLGDTIYKLKAAKGNNIHIVNVLNDRGVHICKSMLAYKLYGEGKTPESEHIKSDHFVGEYYVRYAKAASESEEKAKELEAQANNMLEDWEANKPDVRALWQTMNDWAIKGFHETYNRLGFKMEKEYAESDTYLGGKAIIQEYLEKGVFEKNEKGAIIVDLADKGLDKKVLLRANGTAIYITQDINMAKLRHEDYKFDEMIYVVGNEQEYHFKVLFEIFKLLEWPFNQFGGNCQHFSYGMIELPSGKMKSREGNVIDTDTLLDQMQELAYNAVKERYSDLDEKEMRTRAEIIGTGAVRFFFLKYDPLKNFVFDPQASLSFEGETGPYVQYTHARICSILRKSDQSIESADLSLLATDEEKQLLKQLASFNDIVKQAAELKPHKLCQYTMRLAQSFNSYYGSTQFIQEDKHLEQARLALLTGVKDTIKESLALLGIQSPEQM